MNDASFNNVVNGQIDICKSILLKKAGEYAAEDDRLHNFKRAAGLTGDDPVKALSGMMLKHTVSVYDMCGDKDPSHFDMALWDEKITDSINYLLLLKALVIDEKEAAKGMNLEIPELLQKTMAINNKELAKEMNLEDSEVRPDVPSIYWDGEVSKEKVYLKTCPECGDIMRLHVMPTNNSGTSGTKRVWVCSMCDHWEDD